MLGLFKSKNKSTQAKILVVDDEPDCVSTIQCRLEWCRYDVVTAANGQEGLEKAASEKPDLILLDTNMPVMNGHQMLQRLRRDPALKHTPVIMVTVLCEPQDVSKASSLGVEDYVAKPFNITELLNKIEEVLKKRALSEV
jgi:two-component system cell cycle response regulator